MGSEVYLMNLRRWPGSSLAVAHVSPGKGKPVGCYAYLHQKCFYPAKSIHTWSSTATESMGKEVHRSMQLKNFLGKALAKIGKNAFNSLQS